MVIKSINNNIFYGQFRVHGKPRMPEQPGSAIIDKFFANMIANELQITGLLLAVKGKLEPGL